MRISLLKTKIKEIEESLELVEEYLPDDREEFLSLGIIKDGIYKRLEFCIENVFDICAVLNADYNLGIPGSDEDIVDNLIRNKILPEETKGKLGSMKGFRNIIVHRYGKLDDNLAFNIVSENLGDFYEFISLINDHLERQNPDKQ
ncbi:MAG: DUF86 domain-containing protein [Euryarchaeota archaeon]|nr:DUF86 domain-containing protein [Euryarchaeota archaeon]